MRSIYTGDVVSVVLAGGEGTRLMPLTTQCSKPALPFGGKYRVVDFVLSNLVHSNLLRIHVLTQYQSFSLIRHLSQGWNFSAHLGQYCQVIPATSGSGKGWYQGSADAVYQNLSEIRGDSPKYVAIFGSDHIYRMDVQQMLEEHVASGADATVAVVPQPINEGKRFGCVEVNEQMRVTAFAEKSDHPPAFGSDGGQCLASMGNYLFNLNFLSEVLQIDHGDPESRHDLGGDILARYFDRIHLHAYNFSTNRVPGATDEELGYWRDVGTLETYWSASMDLVSVSPVFNLYNRNWPILTARKDYPPAKFVFADKAQNRLGVATDSLVSAGSIISGGRIDRCVLGPEVRINSYSEVEESVLFHGVDVGRRCSIRKAIIDKGIRIPSGVRVGYDEQEDRHNGVFVDDSGIRVIAQGAFSGKS